MTSGESAGGQGRAPGETMRPVPSGSQPGDEGLAGAARHGLGSPAGEDDALPHRVLVVGAGVSGCAAAATLADRGVPVTLLSAALDVVGLPAYGPVLAGPPRDVVQPLAFLPGWFRQVWTDGARCVNDRDGVWAIDRRLVSINTKWVLENHPLIDLRQGLVVDVHEGTDGSGRVEVETVFGERVEARACVLAIGTALGGRIQVGEVSLAGSRLGEVAADALLESLRRRGVATAPAKRAVGARVRLSGEAQVALEGIALAVGGRVARLSDCNGKAPLAADEVALRPAGLPPLVEAEAELALLAGGSAGDVTEAEAPEFGPAGIWPDGAATGEWYLTPDLDAAALPDVSVTRPAHQVEWHRVVGGAAGARIPSIPNCWVAGQAAGAAGYFASLKSGVGTAAAVVEALAPAGDLRPPS